MEFLEAVPGDRGLEGVVQQAVGDQPLAVVGRTDEGLAPGIGQRVARLSRRLRVEVGTVVGHAFQRAAHPGVYGWSALSNASTAR